MTKGGKFIQDFHVGEMVAGTFLVRSKSLLTTSAGKPYLDLFLQDKTGSINCKVWEKADLFADTFSEGDFVRLRGKVVQYHEQLQLKTQILRPLKKAERQELNFSDFYPSTEHDVATMMARVREHLSTLRHPFYRRVAAAFLDDEDFITDFQRSPAAKEIHHAYLGGLLEHTLSLLDLVDRVAGHYPAIDRDLLLCGAFVHDLGKIEELNPRRFFDFSVGGELIGHIVLGAKLLHKKIVPKTQEEEEKTLLLEHLVLSHQGAKEWGAPVLPKIPEAILLSFLDNIDAKMNIYAEAKRKKRKGDPFTAYSRPMRRRFYAPHKGDGAWEEEKPEEVQ